MEKTGMSSKSSVDYKKGFGYFLVVLDIFVILNSIYDVVICFMKGSGFDEKIRFIIVILGFASIMRYHIKKYIKKDSTTERNC